MHRTERLVPVSRLKLLLKRCKSSGIDHIPAELIQARGNTARSQTHKFIYLYLE